MVNDPKQTNTIIHGHTSVSVAVSAPAQASASAPVPSSFPPSFSVCYRSCISSLASPEWRSAVLDYERLRVQIKKVVHEERLHSKSGSANPAKSVRMFFIIIRSEVDKVRSFAHNKFNECERGMDKIQNQINKIQTEESTPSPSPSLSPSPSPCSPPFSHCVSFCRVLLEQHAHEWRPLLHRPLLQQAQQQMQAVFRFDSQRAAGLPTAAYPISPSSAHLYDLFHQFLAVLRQFDELVRYCVLSQWALWKTTRKFAQYATNISKDDESTLSDISSLSLVDAPALARLANALVDKIIPLMDKTKQQFTLPSCIACNGSIDSASLVLSCGHRCCLSCFARVRAANSLRCPLTACARKQTIDGARVDSTLIILAQASSRTGDAGGDSKRPAKRARVASLVAPAFSAQPPLQARPIDVPPVPVAVPASAAAAAGSVSSPPVSRPFVSNVPSSGPTHGSSCHQCKSAKSNDLLMFCTIAADVKKRRCRKKYCSSCLERCYHPSVSHCSGPWACPACLGLCTCVKCNRERTAGTNNAKQENNNTQTMTG